MNRQQDFISTVRAALDNPVREDRRRRAIFEPGGHNGRQALAERIRPRSARQRQRLLDVLTRQAAAVNLPVIPVSDPESAAAAIRRLVQEKKPEWGRNKSVVAWQHPLIEQLNLPQALAASRIPVYLPPSDPVAADPPSGQLRNRVKESFVGITSADYCLAQTATLVIRSGPGRPRSVSLVPSIHVAVISDRQIITDLAELYALLNQTPGDGQKKLTNCMTFITGPSKTADIELNMVYGAHGPREVYLYVVLS